jgi:hypothetical protein
MLARGHGFCRARACSSEADGPVSSKPERPALDGGSPRQAELSEPGGHLGRSPLSAGCEPTTIRRARSHSKPIRSRTSSRLRPRRLNVFLAHLPRRSSAPRSTSWCAPIPRTMPAPDDVRSWHDETRQLRRPMCSWQVMFMTHRTTLADSEEFRSGLRICRRLLTILVAITIMQ